MGIDDWIDNRLILVAGYIDWRLSEIREYK